MKLSPSSATVKSSLRAPSLEASRISTPIPATNGKCILLADDDLGARESLAAVLRRNGYLILPARDGQEALAFVGKRKVDLVLLDLNMPGKIGWDTFKRIATENPLLPVIIITARRNQLFTALAAGVGALLEKPLDIPALLKAITALLGESAETRLARVAGQRAAFVYQPAQERQSPPAGERWGINE